MNEALRVLVDTCVWVDMYLGEREGHEDARALADASLEAGALLLYSITTCKDAYYLMESLQKRSRRASGRGLSAGDVAAIKRIAKGGIAHMRSLATAVALDEGDVWVAEKLQSVHPDFEDNFVIAAAMRAKADFIVTTDEQLIAHSPVAALTPKNAIAYLKTGVS